MLTSRFLTGVVLAATLCIALATSACAQQQTQASGPALFVARDADSTLYLYGTIHLRRTGEAWGSPAVEAALSESDEIWTEMEISPATDAETQQLATRYGLAPPGRPLSSWLTAEEAVTFRADLTRLGIQPQALEPLRPWLASLTISLAPIIQAGYNPDAGVDRAIDAFGDAHGKRMRAFETPEEQISFFANLPDALQRQVLLESVAEAEKGVAELNAMSAAWSRGDTAELERVLNEEMSDEYPEVYAALITNRNAAWMETIMAELSGSGVDFVAVGAAHVVGDDGLVALLRARGVSVERVDAP